MTEIVWVIALSAAGFLGWRAVPRRIGVVFLCGGLAVWMLVRAVQRLSTVEDLTVGVVPVAAVVAAGCWYRFVHSRTVVNRWGRAVRRKSGVASTWDIARFGSSLAMRRQATTVRPKLAELNRRKRMRVPTAEYAMSLCRAGVMRVHASIEDVVLVFGGPRCGKSGMLASRIIEAPGAVLVTSTRTDLYMVTTPLREAHHGPVRVFNPTGLGGLASTLMFDPVVGCRDPLTAAERAEDMLPCGSGESEREHWIGQARAVYAALLHAAAFGNHSCQMIAEWISDPGKAQLRVAQLLERSPDTTYGTSALQFFTTNDRTRSSITSSMRPALEWLVNPDARAACCGGQTVDVADLLATHGTVHLLGAKAAHTGPLLAALTGHIARQARRIAAEQPTGRLPDPLTLALDEVASVSPVPLEQWTADMGGRGVHIIACFQSRAQLLSRWGTAGGAEIINNAGAIVLFGGTNDRDDLTYWSVRCGMRDEEVLTTDQQGQISGRSQRQVPVLSPAQLANLPKFKVVVIRRHMAPVIGRAAMVWERRDVRAHTRAERAVLAAAQRATRPAWGASLRQRVTHTRSVRQINAARRRARGRL